MADSVKGPLQDLERAKYTLDSTKDKSIVRTFREGGDFTNDDINNRKILCELQEINSHLERMSYYLALMCDEE